MVCRANTMPTLTALRLVTFALRRISASSSRRWYFASITLGLSSLALNVLLSIASSSAFRFASSASRFRSAIPILPCDAPMQALVTPPPTTHTSTTQCKATWSLRISMLTNGRGTVPLLHGGNRNSTVGYHPAHHHTPRTTRLPYLAFDRTDRPVPPSLRSRPVFDSGSASARELDGRRPQPHHRLNIPPLSRYLARVSRVNASVSSGSSPHSELGGAWALDSPRTAPAAPPLPRGYDRDNAWPVAPLPCRMLEPRAVGDGA